MKKNGKPHNAELICLLCDNPVHARYLCLRHYHQQYRAERPELPTKKAPKPRPLTGVKCLVSVCGTHVTPGRVLCSPHNKRAQYWKLTPQRLVEILAPNECSICGTNTALILDHLHGLPCEPRHVNNAGCGDCYRGLLCQGCNRAIGFMKEDVSRFQGAIEYITRSNVTFA